MRASWTEGMRSRSRRGLQAWKSAKHGKRGGRDKSAPRKVGVGENENRLNLFFRGRCRVARMHDRSVHPLPFLFRSNADVRRRRNASIPARLSRVRRRVDPLHRVEIEHRKVGDVVVFVVLTSENDEAGREGERGAGKVGVRGSRDGGDDGEVGVTRGRTGDAVANADGGRSPFFLLRRVDPQLVQGLQMTSLRRVSRSRDETLPTKDDELIPPCLGGVEVSRGGAVGRGRKTRPEEGFEGEEVEGVGHRAGVHGTTAEDEEGVLDEGYRRSHLSSKNIDGRKTISFTSEGQGERRKRARGGGTSPLVFLTVETSSARSIALVRPSRGKG